MLALELAERIRRKGETPLIVLMTDGRANIARDGAAGRERAERDALEAASRCALAGIRALALDTSRAVAARRGAAARRGDGRALPAAALRRFAAPIDRAVRAAARP